MLRHPLVDVSPEHIAALDDEGIRFLIAQLCEADLRRRGLPTSAFLYGGNQIAADNGIDVRIELPADKDISGFIPRPATGFRAKAYEMPDHVLVYRADWFFLKIAVFWLKWALLAKTTANHLPRQTTVGFLAVSP